MRYTEMPTRFTLYSNANADNASRTDTYLLFNFQEAARIKEARQQEKLGNFSVACDTI